MFHICVLPFLTWHFGSYFNFSMCKVDPYVWCLHNSFGFFWVFFVKLVLQVLNSPDFQQISFNESERGAINEIQLCLFCTVLIKSVYGWKPAEWSWTSARLAMPGQARCQGKHSLLLLENCFIKVVAEELCLYYINNFFTLANVHCEHFMSIIHLSPF